MDDTKQLGKKGEELARRHLARLGYRILEKNYRTPAGEIDLVASDGDTLVFVEVKSRRDTSFGAPELAVNGRKKKNLARAALMYITRNKKQDTHCRFDVVSVMQRQGSGHKIRVIKDAFELAGGY